MHSSWVSLGSHSSLLSLCFLLCTSLWHQRKDVSVLSKYKFCAFGSIVCSVGKLGFSLALCHQLLSVGDKKPSPCPTGCPGTSFWCKNTFRIPKNCHGTYFQKMACVASFILFSVGVMYPCFCYVFSKVSRLLYLFTYKLGFWWHLQASVRFIYCLLFGWALIHRDLYIISLITLEENCFKEWVQKLALVLEFTCFYYIS